MERDTWIGGTVDGRGTASRAEPASQRFGMGECCADSR